MKYSEEEQKRVSETVVRVCAKGHPTIMYYARRDKIEPSCPSCKPKVKLLGVDGNAFNILGLCLQSAKTAGWSQERIEKLREEMISQDYRHLLRIAMENFDII